MLRSFSRLIAMAAIGAVAVPYAAAAQSFDPDGGRRFVFHAEDDFEVDRDRAPAEPRQDVGPRYWGDIRTPEPRVVYDERDPYRRGGGWRRDDGRFPAYRYGRPDPVYGRYGTRFEGPGRPVYGPRPYGGADTIRPVSEPVEPSFGTDPDFACAVEQTQSITAAGWHKIVTHRVCYRR